VPSAVTHPSSHDAVASFPMATLAKKEDFTVSGTTTLDEDEEVTRVIKNAIALATGGDDSDEDDEKEDRTSPTYNAVHRMKNADDDESELKELVQGNIVLVSRGECSFAYKVFHLQSLGAIAVVVRDNDPKNGDHLIVMAMDSGDDADEKLKITIPSIFVSYRAGMKLREEIGPSKVDLFRADEEWIGPMMDVPAPLLLVFTFIMFTLSFIITASFLRACCRLRHSIRAGRQYVINNRGLLEPLGANVVIIDGSAKQDEENETEIYDSDDQQNQGQITTSSTPLDAVTMEVNTTEQPLLAVQGQQQQIP